MNIISGYCHNLMEARLKLRKKYEAKQKAIAAINAEHDEAIRELQTECTTIRAGLISNLESSREFFKSPKSRVFYGITVGFKKGQDKVTLPTDETILVKRVETMLPAKQAETVLDRSVTIIKAAFKKLPRDLLQKLGCSIVTGADEVVVHTADDDIETLVQKSLGDGATAEAAK
jgi:hypothetical protein